MHDAYKNEQINYILLKYQSNKNLNIGNKSRKQKFASEY